MIYHEGYLVLKTYYIYHYLKVNWEYKGCHENAHFICYTVVSICFLVGHRVFQGHPEKEGHLYVQMFCFLKPVLSSMGLQ